MTSTQEQLSLTARHEEMQGQRDVYRQSIAELMISDTISMSDRIRTLADLQAKEHYTLVEKVVADSSRHVRAAPILIRVSGNLVIGSLVQDRPWDFVITHPKNRGIPDKDNIHLGLVPNLSEGFVIANNEKYLHDGGCSGSSIRSGQWPVAKPLSNLNVGAITSALPEGLHDSLEIYLKEYVSSGYEDIYDGVGRHQESQGTEMRIRPILHAAALKAMHQLAVPVQK